MVAYLAHLLGLKVPIVNNPGRGWRNGAPVTGSAEVEPCVVAQPGTRDGQSVDLIKRCQSSVALHTPILEAGQGNVKSTNYKGCSKKKVDQPLLIACSCANTKRKTLSIVLVCSETNL